MTTRNLPKLIGGPMHGERFEPSGPTLYVPAEPLPGGRVHCCPEHCPVDHGYRTLTYRATCFTFCAGRWHPFTQEALDQAAHGLPESPVAVRFWHWDQLTVNTAGELAWLQILEDAGLGA